MALPVITLRGPWATSSYADCIAAKPPPGEARITSQSRISAAGCAGSRGKRPSRWRMRELFEGGPERFGRFGGLSCRMALEQLSHRRASQRLRRLGRGPRIVVGSLGSAPRLRPAECCSRPRCRQIPARRAELPVPAHAGPAKRPAGSSTFVSRRFAYTRLPRAIAQHGVPDNPPRAPRFYRSCQRSV